MSVQPHWEVLQERLAPVRDLPRSERGMSNFDNAIDEGLEEDLRAGMVTSHAAWNFNGTYVWFADGMFHEAVFRYHGLQEIVSAPDLRALMDEVNERYGWE
jgi:hypothetical protein